MRKQEHRSRRTPLIDRTKTAWPLRGTAMTRLLASAALLATVAIAPTRSAAQEPCTDVAPEPVTPVCSSSRDCDCTCCDTTKPCHCASDGRTPCLYCPPSSYRFDDRYVFAMTRQLRRANINTAGTVMLAPFTIVADTAFLPFAVVIGAFG